MYAINNGLSNFERFCEGAGEALNIDWLPFVWWNELSNPVSRAFAAYNGGALSPDMATYIGRGHLIAMLAAGAPGEVGKCVRTFVNTAYIVSGVALVALGQPLPGIAAIYVGVLRELESRNFIDWRLSLLANLPLIPLAIMGGEVCNGVLLGVGCLPSISLLSMQIRRHFASENEREVYTAQYSDFLVEVTKKWLPAPELRAFAARDAELLAYMEQHHQTLLNPPPPEVVHS